MFKWNRVQRHRERLEMFKTQNGNEELLFEAAAHFCLHSDCRITQPIVSDRRVRRVTQHLVLIYIWTDIYTLMGVTRHQQ